MTKALLPALAIAALLACCKKKDDQTYVTPMPNPDTTAAVIAADTVWPVAAADHVFYEVNLRAQGAAGTFGGLAGQLDSLKALGVNTLWLMPIHPVGRVRAVPPLGSPYAVQDYQAVNPEFGTLADLKSLIAQAHARKMPVVLDWVANHTAWDHPWIAAHKEWYSQNAAGEIIIPPTTNWQDVADLNYNNTAMRLAMIEAMRYWVREAGVDGFRCDAANFVPNSFWRQALDSLKRLPTPRPLILLAEGDRTDHYSAGFQTTFGWALYAKLKSVFKDGQAVSGLFSVLASENASVPAGAAKLRFTTNHDETAYDDTPMGLFGGKAGALAASAITIGAGGAGLLYNGQEAGSTQKTPIFSRSTLALGANPDMRQAYKAMLTLRRRHPALRSGTLESFTDADVAALRRKAGRDEVLVLANVRNRTVTYTLPATLAYTRWTSLAGKADSLGATLALPAYGYGMWVRTGN